MAITINPGIASTNPGASAKLIATASSGSVQLLQLGLGAAPATNNRMTIVDGGQIGQAAGPLIEFDDTNNYLEITGCNVGIGTTTPAEKLDVAGNGRFSTSLSSSDLSISDEAELHELRAPGNGGTRITNSQGNLVGYLGQRVAGANGSGPITVTDNFNLMFGSGKDYSIAYRSSDDKLIISDGYDFATPIVTIDNNGNVGIGTTSPDRLLHAEKSDAVTNAVTYAQRLSHISSSTVVAGFGTGIEYELEENDGTSKIAGITECLWTDAGAVTNADADFVWKLMLNDATAAEKARLTSGGDFKVTGDFYSATNQGLSGTMTLDDGANWRATLTFTGGILTGQTTGASEGATASWA